MPHFRQDPLIAKHLEVTTGSFTHRYKGKEYEIKSNTIDSLTDEMIQSLSTRLSKLYPTKKKVPRPKQGSSNDGASDIKLPGQDAREVNEIITERLIEKELKRLATVEFLVEDKLHYPRVFMKLLSQPHLALEEKRLVTDEKQELYLYVDRSVGYNEKDRGFHNTMIKVASKIKGIKVFDSRRLRFDGNYYWDHVVKNVPKNKKVLVFSQGCGGTDGVPPSGYDIHFCTHFEKNCNCGCDTIPTHESHSRLFHIHYGYDTPEKLKSLSIK